MTAVFILFMIGVYPSFQNNSNFLNQSCHSYVIHLHDEVFFKNLDLEVSGTQIYFCEIVLKGKTLFYKPKKMVVTKSVECTPFLYPKVLNQFVDCKGLFLDTKRE